MTDETPQIEVGQRVELLPDYDQVYKKAVGGAQGYVRDKERDEDGFDTVRIEWDKEHPRYTGQPDGWSFEHHFVPVYETTIFNAVEDPKILAKRMIEKAQEQLGEEDAEKATEQYIEQLNAVVNLLAESDGFILIATKQIPHPEEPGKQVMVPVVRGAYLNEMVMTLLEAQLTQMGAMAQGEASQLLIEHYRRMNGDEDD
jgi:hypothetical protein